MDKAINKTECLKTDVSKHMDIDYDYQELIENNLDGIKELFANEEYNKAKLLKQLKTALRLYDSLETDNNK